MMPEVCIGEAKPVSATQVAWVLQGKELIAFERHLSLVKKGGNHCHINVVPIPASAAPKCKQVGASLHATWLAAAVLNKHVTVSQAL